MNEQQIAELFRDEWSTVNVGPAPVDAVVSASGRHRRRIVTGVTLGLAAVLALAVVLAVAIREPKLDPVDAVVRTEQNPLDVAWVERDELHLDSVVVAVPARDDVFSNVVSLAQVPDADSYGAVYSLADGPVVHVDQDGRATTIDDPGTRVRVGGSGTAWVAWVDPSGEAPELVVWDTESDEQVTRQPLSYDPFETNLSPRGPILAIDGERVFVSTPDEDLLWEPGMDAPEPVELAEGHRLLDVAGDVQLTVDRLGNQVRISTDRRPDVTMPGGFDARLSPDGRHVWPGSPNRASTLDPLRIIDVDTGQRTTFDLKPIMVLDGHLGDSSVTFVIGRDYTTPEDADAAPSGSHELSLVTCALADGSCVVADDEVVGTDPVPGSPLVFPR